MNSVSKQIGIKKSIGFSLNKIWYKKIIGFGIKKSIRFGIEQIWYKKVSGFVKFGINIGIGFKTFPCLETDTNVEKNGIKKVGIKKVLDSVS